MTDLQKKDWNKALERYGQMPCVSESIEVVQPDYTAAFGNLARLVTGAIEAHDDEVRQAYLDRCNVLIEQVYSPTCIVSNK